jgi:hypothetical protein
MTLYEQIIEALPELADKPKEFGAFGSIELKDDSDGLGAYIAKWDYSKPIPDGMKVGK